MSTRRKINATEKLIGEWPLTPAATLGSSVRAKAIFLEIRARLPTEFRKLLHIESRVLTLRLSEGGAENDVQVAFGIVSKALQNIEALPVIPREIEAILTISTATAPLAEGWSLAERRDENGETPRAGKEHHLSRVRPAARGRCA
jgi:hypothetical protein